MQRTAFKHTSAFTFTNMFLGKFLHDNKGFIKYCQLSYRTFYISFLNISIQSTRIILNNLIITETKISGKLENKTGVHVFH